MASVSYDNSGANSFGTGSPASTLAVTLTIGSGSSRAIAAVLLYYWNGVEPSAVGISGAGATGWGLVTGTKNTTAVDFGAGNSARMQIWSGIAPSSGSQTVTASWTTNASAAALLVYAASSVDQSTPVYNGNVVATNSVLSSWTLTATTAASDLGFDATLDGFGGETVSGGDASQVRKMTGIASGAFGFSGSTAVNPSGTSTVFGWSIGGNSGNHGQTLGVFKALGAAPPAAPAGTVWTFQQG